MELTKKQYQRLILFDRRHWLNVALIVFLSAMSFYTSFDGISRYIDFGGAVSSAVATLLLTVIVLVIQLLLIVSLMNMSRNMSWVGKLIWLFLYLFTMAVSVFFSYSFYYKLMQADNHAVVNFETQLDHSVINATVYKESFAEVRDTAQRLANYSAKTAETERLQGKTCGDDSPAGEGPRRDLREEEAALFTQLSGDISVLFEKTDTDISELNAIRQAYSPQQSVVENVQQSMNLLISRINRQREAALLKRVKEELVKHSGDARLALKVERRNQIIACPDKEITRSVNVLLENLDSLPQLDEIALFNSQDDKAVMVRAMQVFLSLPDVIREAFFPFVHANEVSDEDASLQNQANAIKGSDYAPFILGSMVDLIILLVGFSNGKKSNQRDYLQPDFAGEYFSVRDAMKIQQAFSIKDLRNVLRQHLYSAGHRHFFVIPSEVYAELAYSSQLIDLFESLVTAKRLEVPSLLHIPLSVLPESLQQRFLVLFQGSRTQPFFDFYPVTERQRNELVQALHAWHLWENQP